MASSIIRAYATHAVLDGAIQPDGPKVNTRWTGAGSATWKLEIPAADEYEVAVCYACADGGAPIVLSSGSGRIEMKTQTTAGFYTDRSSNYERVPCPSTLKLTAGSPSLTLQLPEPRGRETMRVRSVELIPASAKTRVAEEERDARKARASTEWFAKSGYGLMFHWTGQSQPRTGPAKTYAEAVRDFPVHKFVETIQETGAGHVLFTVNHAIPHCPAPIASWEKYHPGLTTSRDLLGDLADALARVDIRFLLYINSPRFGKLTKDEPGEFSSIVGETQYVDMHCEILDEIGKRYAHKVHGYWFDSWYQSFEHYPAIRQDRVYQACKTGNPDRIAAFNFWVLPVCTPWQEYWAGEVGTPGPLPTSQFIGRGAGAGLQFHSLLYLDAPWVHGRLDAEMEPPRFSAEDLSNYVQSCMQNQGVVTVNLGVYQEASIGPQARELMWSVRRTVRGS